MVDSPFDVLKANVRAARKSDAAEFSQINYNTHLELAVRLVTEAPSLNHYVAQMDTYPWREIPDLGEILASLRAIEHLVGPFDAEGQPSEYERYERWQLLAAIWLSAYPRKIDTAQASSPFHELLCHCADLDGLRIPTMLGQGEVLTLAQSAAQAPNEAWILSAWLFEKEGLCIEHWDRLEQAAEKFGYGEMAAARYRAACRESVNHSWDPRSAIALGVYDLPVDRPMFFRDGESDEQFMSRIDTIWRWEEPEAFED